MGKEKEMEDLEETIELKNVKPKDETITILNREVEILESSKSELTILLSSKEEEIRILKSNHDELLVKTEMQVQELQSVHEGFFALKRVEKEYYEYQAVTSAKAVPSEVLKKLREKNEELVEQHEDMSE